MNSRLLNIPAIVAAILTISIGTYIYNASQATITDSITAISTQEINAFNSLFIMYEGEQTGSNIKSLILRLKSNANTYSDEREKVPYVYIDKPNETSNESFSVMFSKRSEGDITEYVESLNELSSKIDTAHTYYVEMSYQDNGLIDYINISFDLQNKVELKHRT